MDDFQAILSIVDSLTSVGLLLWLIVQERSERKAIGEQYREDLREVAGIRQGLARTQQTVALYQQNSGSET